MSNLHVPRTIAYHLGARHHYAIPAALASVGALEAFYTDMCSSVGLGRLSWLASRFPLPQRLSRLTSALANRVLPDEVRKATFTCDLTTLRYHYAASQARNRLQAAIALYEFRVEMSERMRRRGLKTARQVYAVMGEGNSFLRQAKEQGARVALDVVIAPSWHKRVMQEQMAYPGWSAEQPNWAAPTSNHPSIEEESIKLADLYVCPSEFVRSDLIEEYKIDPSKTVLVPYGVAEAFFSIKNVPRAGHVLLGGSATLRKGIHYFALAANLLAGEGGSSYLFSVAGELDPGIVARPECGNLHFLGRIPRPQMRAILSETDVFALPSVAEGSAGVTYEALAAGVPVVTTPAAGSVVRDGVDGFVVPTGDAPALADALRTIVTDRQLRERMATAARERARNYNWSRYAARLMRALADPLNGP